MLVSNKLLETNTRGCAYSLLVETRAVPLSGTPLQTPMNACGPEHCWSDLAQIARATREVRKDTRSAEERAVPRLPEVFYGMSAGSARTECEGGDHLVCRASTTIDGGWIFPETMKIFMSIFMPTSRALCNTREQHVNTHSPWCITFSFEALTCSSAAGCLPGSF